MRNELKENNRRLRKNRELIEYDLPHCLDFFALLLRDGAKTEYELIKAFNLALMECSNVAIRMMFFARERLKDVETYKLLLKFLANYHPSIMSKTVRFVPEHGCAEDLLILVGSPSENALGKYLRRRLTEQKMCNIFQGRKILNHYHDYQNMFLLSSDVLRIVIWLAKLDQERDLEKIKVFCRDSAFGAYISCRAEAYGFNVGFSELWISEDERGKILCAVSSLDKNAVVLSDENCNFEELSVLIDSFGFKSILTDVKTADNCSLCGFEKKAVLKLKKCEEALETNSNPDLKSVYELYCSVFPKRYRTDKESYLTWLSDFTFRKNRNLADMETVETEGAFVAAAMTAAESAVLSFFCSSSSSV